MENRTPVTCAVAYMRCSGFGQVSGDTWDRQRAAIESYCASNGLAVVRWYQEEAVSGKTEHDDRPTMRRMLAELAAGQVTTIVIEKMDRLARDLIIQEGIISRLRQSGYTLVSTVEPDLCSDDPSRKFIRRVLGAVAELDRDLIVSRTRAARARIRGAGQRCEGRKPYGDRPGEAEVLKLMREHAGQGPFHLAELLNSKGIKPRAGAKWWPATVSRILKREGL